MKEYKYYTFISPQWLTWLKAKEMEKMQERLDQCVLFDSMTIKATKVLNTLYAIYGLSDQNHELTPYLIHFFLHFGCIANYSECSDGIYDFLGVSLIMSNDVPKMKGRPDVSIELFEPGKTLMEMAIAFQDNHMFQFMLSRGVGLIDPMNNNRALLYAAIASSDEIACAAIAHYRFNSVVGSAFLSKNFYQWWESTFKETTFLRIISLNDPIKSETIIPRILLSSSKIKALLCAGYTDKKMLYFSCADLLTFQWCVQQHLLDRAAFNAFYAELLTNYIYLHLYDIVEFILAHFASKRHNAELHLPLLHRCLHDPSEMANTSMCKLYQACKTTAELETVWLSTGRTPLQEVAILGDMEKAKCLISMGESLTVYDGVLLGKTAETYAKQHGHTALATYLHDIGLNKMVYTK